MIWCVEDDASIRDIEIYALRAAGFEVQGFPDGDSFWDALQQQHPDLVVLDVMLPGADGTELLRRMRATPSLSAIPVILATARGAEYDRVSGLDSGADDYLVKPFSVMELASRVRAVLRCCKPSAEKRLLHLLTLGVVLHGGRVGPGVIQHRAVGLHPGDAVVVGGELAQVRFALPLYRRSGDGQLVTELALLHTDVVVIETAQDHRQRGQQHRQAHRQGGVKNSFCHTVSSQR